MKNITVNSIVGLLSVASGMIWSASAAVPAINNDPRAPGWRALPGTTTAKWGYRTDVVAPNASLIDSFTNPNGTPAGFVRKGTGGSWSAYSASWTNAPDGGNLSISNVVIISRTATAGSGGFISNNIPQAVADAPAYRIMQVQNTWYDAPPSGNAAAISAGSGAVLATTEDILTGAANSVGGLWKVTKSVFRLPDATRAMETNILSCTAASRPVYNDAVIVDTINVPVHRDVTGDAPVVVPSLAVQYPEIIATDVCTPPGPYTTTTPVTCHTVDIYGYDNVVAFTVTVNGAPPPTANPFSFGATLGELQAFDIARLTFAPGAAGQVVSFFDVFTEVSTRPGTVVSNFNGKIYYWTPVTTPGTDSFSYRVKDLPSGLMATATITVNLKPASGTQNMFPPTPPVGGVVTVKAQGIPGVLYQLQRMVVDPAGPWLPTGLPQRADAQGKLSWDDTVGSESYLYRTQWVPEDN